MPMFELQHEIMEELRRIEREEQVRIVYACESGSRAWGFPSQDSDFDVRFIYVRRAEWYLSIFEKRDVIERPISDMLDISGWDLSKALWLFRKSNPPLLEWLQSPIQYHSSTGVADRIRELAALSFSPRSVIYHYLHMARGNYRDYLQGETVKIKKYFYVLRPLLACAWVERRQSMPPMDFETLLQELIPAGTELRVEIERLLVRKKAGEELNLEPRIHAINAYIEEKLAYFERIAPSFDAAKGVPDSTLDELFLWSLKAAGMLDGLPR
jgi:predicted nucleotidyltransferase